MRGRVMMIVCAVVLSCAAQADAAKFHGKTSRGKAVTLITAQNGTYRRLAIHWRARCRKPGFVYKTATLFRPRPGQQTRHHIGAYGYYLVGNPKHRNAKVLVRMRGKRVSPYRWGGTLRASAKLRKGRHVYDKCSTPRLRWHASIHRVHIHLKSDPDDYVLRGQTVDRRTPRDKVRLGGSRYFLGTKAGPYSVLIAAPAHKKLRTGVSFKTAGIGLVSSPKRFCNEPIGRVKVNRARFTRRGKLIAIRVHFVQHCDGAKAALRGLVTYHR